MIDKVSQNLLNVARGLIQRHGSSSLKRQLWNREYASGRWRGLDDADIKDVQLVIEKYANQGRILDLGCGSGTTSIDLSPNAYTFYTGVDISDLAIRSAQSRARECGRSDRNEYCFADILTFIPSKLYDAILYQESIYYIPQQQIAPMLRRYSDYLTHNGVFIARLYDTNGRRCEILNAIQHCCDIVEKRIHTQTGVCLLVFRPAPALAPAGALVSSPHT